ncbi:MAG TPA: amidohydrolase, partial [Balneolaceae bacterium]|nr:amidohydrolase [Balneolaceae bacterium]
MKNFLLLILSPILLISCSAPQAQTAFTNVNVLPMDSDQVLANQTVIIENERIIQVGNSEEI